MNLKKAIFLILLVPAIAGCTDDTPTPKPVGYFRIDLPEPAYQPKDFDCPFNFETSKYSRLEFFQDAQSPCWFNISYPDLKAKIHITYRPINGDIRGQIEDARGLAYEHQIKASRISTTAIRRDSANVYGLVYDMGGNVASPYQFYLTDSTNHFIRGSLYFSALPNPDSIQPALDYVKRDMERFIDSFRWKEN